MKLVDCQAFVVKTPKPHLGGQSWFMLKLTTDDGIVGWGEAVHQRIFFSLEQSFKTLCGEIFERWLKGRDPMRRGFLTKQMYRDLSAQRPGLMEGCLISAFDLALWDIAGKSAGLPVYEMLGGRYRDRIRSYSYLCRPDQQEEKPTTYQIWSDPSLIADCALEMVEEGFTAIKFDPLRHYTVKGTEPPLPYPLTLDDLKLFDLCTAAVRNAVGERCDIIIGTHGQMPTSSAIRLAKVLEPYRPLWFEEPAPPENAKEMAKVRAMTTVPIASGERLTTSFEFQHLLEEGAISIAQPDLGSCGGITECAKIAHLCETYYTEVAPHVYGGPVITAAGIQMATTMPNFLILESIYKSRHFTSRILTHSMGWENGYYSPLDKPGLGIEIDETELRKHCI